MLGGKQLDVARGVVIVALGEVVLDAQGYGRALRISPNQTEHVVLLGLNITGGFSDDGVSPSPSQPASQPHAAGRLHSSSSPADAVKECRVRYTIC